LEILSVNAPLSLRDSRSAQQACRKGFRTLHRRAARLLHELPLARADGTYLRLLTKLARVDVLLVDDWGLDLRGGNAWLRRGRAQVS
jgi:hypothetical protein